MAKASRADLHERFAHWIDEPGANLVELDELVGYHLEQAAQFQGELGQADPDLVGRAGEGLAAAGRRALSRGDFVAARELLGRALELTRPLALDVHLEIDFANAHEAIPEKVAIAEAAAARACAVGDETGDALARAVVARWRLLAGGDPTEAETTAKEALRLLEQANDHAGLKEAWLALGNVAILDGRFADFAHALENALLHALLASEREPARGTALDFGVYEFGYGLTHGPQPADEALTRLEHLKSGLPPQPTVLFRSLLMAMLGRLDDAWQSACEAGERLYEVTGRFRGEPILYEIALLRRDYGAAAELLRRTCAMCEEDGELAILSTYAACLGRVLAMLGDYDEAERVARQGRDLGLDRDFATQALWRQAQARVCAARREHAEAERLAREAVAIVERTDALNQQGDAFSDLAHVLTAAGRIDEAVVAFEDALDRYRRKKNLAMVAQVQPQLNALRAIQTV